MTRNVTCEDCYEEPAIITAILPRGSEMPLCKKCAIAYMNAALQGEANLYVAQTDDEEEN